MPRWAIVLVTLVIVIAVVANPKGFAAFLLAMFNSLTTFISTLVA
jgi:hypothetical protein